MSEKYLSVVIFVWVGGGGGGGGGLADLQDKGPFIGKCIVP